MVFGHRYYWVRDNVMEMVRCVDLGENGWGLQKMNGEMLEDFKEDEIVPLSMRNYKKRK